MKLSIIQGQIQWHKPEENIRHFNELINAIDNSDIIILPEMWISGFTMKAEVHFKDFEEGLAQMEKWSLKHDALIAGSLIYEEKGHYYNRMLLVENGKLAASYDKKHLFGVSGEDRHYAKGDRKVIYEYKGWRICPMICYDLRFPVWCRNLEDYDLLIFSANWPDKRSVAWKSLLKARAIENQCYVAGANCFGADPWNNTYEGHSCIYSFDGTLMADIAAVPGFITEELQKESMMKFREDLPFLKDRDQFQLINED